MVSSFSLLVCLNCINAKECILCGLKIKQFIHIPGKGERFIFLLLQYLTPLLNGKFGRLLCGTSGCQWSIHIVIFFQYLTYSFLIALVTIDVLCATVLTILLLFLVQIRKKNTRIAIYVLLNQSTYPILLECPVVEIQLCYRFAGCYKSCAI